MQSYFFGLTVIAIGHFGKYHNTLRLSPQLSHKHCFEFLLGLSMVPRENKNNVYSKFEGTNKEYYGIFQRGLLGTRGGSRIFIRRECTTKEWRS